MQRQHKLTTTVSGVYMEVWGPLIAVVVPAVSAVAGAFGFLWKQVRELNDKHRECEIRTAVLASEIAILQADMDREAREGLAQIVADSDGIIREWSPGATLLFRWTQRQALGKHMTIVFPERLRDGFNEGFAKVMASGRSPKHGPHDTIGLLRTGEEIPLTVWYSGWESEDGSVLFAMTARFRPVVHEGELANGEDPHP